MRTPHGHQVAYNAQSVVDAKHKLIVAFDLTNDGNDQQQLQSDGGTGQGCGGRQRGYGRGRCRLFEWRAWGRCEQDGITAIVPRAATVNPKGKQYFSRDRFSYDPETDSWRCPAGETLSLYSHTQQKKEYTSKACSSCPLKAQCTQAARRVIVRGFHEDARGDHAPARHRPIRSG